MKQGEKPESKVGQTTKPMKRPDVFEPCSRCGDKPCHQNTWRRKWSGGVGLCLTCYDIVRKEEKGATTPSAKAPETKKAATPTSESSVPEPTPPSSVSPTPKPTNADPVLLKTFNDPAAARDFVTALEGAGVEVFLEILVSAVPEEGGSH